MARRTAAERRAEAERMRQLSEEARVARESAEYPARLMLAMDRATTSFNYELTVQDQEFVLRDRDAVKYSKDTFYLSYSYDSESYQELENLEYDLNAKAEEKAERERQRSLRKQAFDKLSEEERDALGLTSEFNW